jgi:hypothetical protein
MSEPIRACRHLVIPLPKCVPIEVLIKSDLSFSTIVRRCGGMHTNVLYRDHCLPFTALTHGGWPLYRTLNSERHIGKQYCKRYRAFFQCVYKFVCTKLSSKHWRYFDCFEKLDTYAYNSLATVLTSEPTLSSPHNPLQLPEDPS